MADFDDGTPQHDAFGVLYGIHNTDAALVQPTKRPMPPTATPAARSLINGKIAGVVSVRLRPSPGRRTSTATTTTPATARFGVDTRVSVFADWINSITSVGIGHGEFLVNADDVINLAYDAQGNPITDNLGNSSTCARQPERQPRPLLGGHGLGRRLRHHLDQLRPRRRGQRLRRRRQRRERRLCPPLQRRTRHAQASDVFQVNQTAAGNQQNAKVSMDAAGDFTVTWESNQNGNYDIYARRYARTSLVQYARSNPDDRQLAVPLLVFGQNPLYTTDPLPVTRWSVTDTNQPIQTPARRP